MYKAILHKDAVKFYKRTDTNLRKRINSAIEVIAHYPRYHIHVKKLQGDLFCCSAVALSNTNTKGV